WDKLLVPRARQYPSGVLTGVEPSGYPLSLRCTPEFDDAAEVVRLGDLPPTVVAWRGPVCLLLHRHDPHLEGLYQMVLLGELALDAGAPILRPTRFVTANGRTDTDAMPHAGRPLH